MITLLLCALTSGVLASNAFAADTNDEVGTFELSLRESFLGARDTRWGVFSDNDFYSTLGLQAGYRFHPRLIAIAGYQHGGVATDVYPSESEGYFQAAFRGDQINLGARADLPMADWFHPFVGVQGIGIWGRIRLDDVPDEDDNVNELRFAGLSGGALGTGGVEFRIPMVDGVEVLLDVEVGYGWIAPISFDTVGELGFHGVSTRIGGGVRF